MCVKLKTPTGKDFELIIDYDSGRLTIISMKGNEHWYYLRSLKDLYVWLKINQNSNWVFLGSKGEEEIPNNGTVEEWARSETNPIGKSYGLTPGRRGRFASYVPSVLEYLGFVEVEHSSKNNRVRAL